MKTKLVMSLLKQFYPVILVGGLSLYGYIKIQSLESSLEVSQAQLDRVTSHYEVLLDRYNTLGDEFESFVSSVTHDLHDQRSANQRIRDLNQQYADELEELRNTFERNAQGNRRDSDAMIDRRPTHLEQIINDATRGMRDEFKTIGR